MTKKEEARNYYLKRRDRLDLENLCRRCGKLSRLLGKTRCEACDNYEYKVWGKNRVSSGNCMKCNEVLDSNINICKKCSKAQNDASETRRLLRESKFQCNDCGEQLTSETKLKRCERCRGNESKWRESIKREVIDHYGGKCNCCSEQNPYFLTIDHINGGGKKHRKALGVGGKLYLWLKRKNYPDGYRILCWNCNCGRQVNGGECPHKT